MPVTFGNLDVMLSELKEKDISEVRIETLYEWTEHELPAFLRDKISAAFHS